jgi:hypothetical protein
LSDPAGAPVGTGSESWPDIGLVAADLEGLIKLESIMIVKVFVTGTNGHQTLSQQGLCLMLYRSLSTIVVEADRSFFGQTGFLNNLSQ